jgi:hypothetical protein
MLHLFDLDVPGGIRFRESDSLSGGVRITVQPPDGDPLGTGLPQPPGLDLLICCDIPLPELPLLMQQRQGCTLQACPAAFNTTTGPRHWHLLLRARAVNTQCFLLACSSARPMGGDACPSYGHSLVVDPWDSVIFEAGTGEQVLHAELELGQVALARQAIAIGEEAGRRRFCAVTGFPIERLQVDTEPRLHRALGQYESLGGFGGPWPNLVLMCAEIGSPGTLAEVLRGYKGDRRSPQRIADDEMIQAGPLPPIRGSFFARAGGTGFLRPSRCWWSIATAAFTASRPPWSSRCVSLSLTWADHGRLPAATLLATWNPTGRPWMSATR